MLEEMPKWQEVHKILQVRRPPLPSSVRPLQRLEPTARKHTEQMLCSRKARE